MLIGTIKISLWERISTRLFILTHPYSWKWRQKKIKPMTWVKFDPPKGYEHEYPWEKGTHLLYLGDINKMDGHCVLVDFNGKVYVSYHTENFIEMTEDEI